jgi:pSer/pThr/pTyr-binding forkhead associated (FHA) protein
MAYLELHAGHQTGKKIDLGSTFSLGRASDNDLHLSDQGVSRQHARITRHGECFLLEDLSSSNGTFLREQRLGPGAPSELVDGDEIRIGSTRLIFRLYHFISSSSEIPRPTTWSPNPPKSVSSSPSPCPKQLIPEKKKPSLSELLNSPVPMPTFLRQKGKPPSKLNK